MGKREGGRVINRVMNRGGKKIKKTETQNYSRKSCLFRYEMKKMSFVAE